MADAKNTTKAPAAPSKPAPSTEPVVEKVKKEKKPRVEYKKVFESAEAATKEAGERTKGPRRAFKCTAKDGTVIFAVGHNEGRAGGIAFEAIGGKVEELGGKAKKSKVMTADGIMNLVNALPEDAKAAVLAQLDALKSAKK